MKDIAGRSDVEMLIRFFYDKVKKDPVIGPHFTQVDWSAHLPVMFDFWESVLFFTGNYSGNPMQVHRALHTRMPLRPEHFERWKKLFLESVRELFEGEKADLACTRAEAIAYLMEQKINS